MKIQTFYSWTLRRGGGLFLGLRVQFTTRVWFTAPPSWGYIQDNEVVADMTTVSLGFLFCTVTFQICGQPKP